MLLKAVDDKMIRSRMKVDVKSEPQLEARKAGKIVTAEVKQE